MELGPLPGILVHGWVRSDEVEPPRGACLLRADAHEIRRSGDPVGRAIGRLRQCPSIGRRPAGLRRAGPAGAGTGALSSSRAIVSPTGATHRMSPFPSWSASGRRFYFRGRHDAK